MPHLGEFFVSEDDVDNAGTVNWWVGVESSGEGLDLGHSDFLLSWAVGDQTHATGTFSVYAEVLCEGLEQHDVVGVLGEKSETVGILLEIT